MAPKIELFNQKHLMDFAKIMGVSEELIPLLPRFANRAYQMNPWVRQLPGILRGLNLKAGQRVLDIPCGEGGVSVPLADKYGLIVQGYDIFPPFVSKAREFAKKREVNRLCRFAIDDIRRVVKRQNICNLLLWIAPPHLWRSSNETIKYLRNCVVDGGVILIADAYLYSASGGRVFHEYETLHKMTAGLLSYGDKLIRLHDYEGHLWREDYRLCREAVQDTLGQTKDRHEQEVIRGHLQTLKAEEKKVIQYLGLAIWLLEVGK